MFFGVRFRISQSTAGRASEAGIPLVDHHEQPCSCQQGQLLLNSTGRLSLVTLPSDILHNLTMAMEGVQLVRRVKPQTGKQKELFFLQLAFGSGNGLSLTGQQEEIVNRTLDRVYSEVQGFSNPASAAFLLVAKAEGEPSDAGPVTRLRILDNRQFAFHPAGASRPSLFRDVYL